MATSIKSIVKETLKASSVECSKVYYSKVSSGLNSRTITAYYPKCTCIGDLVKDLLQYSIGTIKDIRIVEKNDTIITLKIYFTCSWKDLEEVIVESYNNKDFEEIEENTEEIEEKKNWIDKLKVGTNVTFFGIFYASDEEDLEKMKEKLREFNFVL